MKGLDNHLYLVLLLIANLIALIQLFLAFKWPRICRITFFLLFAWAAWQNWTTVMSNEREYLLYAGLTWSNFYKDFINGWFSGHIKQMVGSIAICQAIIAVSMLMPGKLFKIGAIGAVAFLLAILPLGVGAGFPSTFIMSVALVIVIIRVDHPQIAIKSKAENFKHNNQPG